jgi:hypothetical protein
MASVPVSALWVSYVHFVYSVKTNCTTTRLATGEEVTGAREQRITRRFIILMFSTNLSLGWTNQGSSDGRVM